MRAKGNAGEHLCTNPPYGYQKDPMDRKKWIVDEEAAEIVRRIFDLCIAGKGPMQIAKLLTAQHVLTVKAHYAQQNGKPLPEKPYKWSPKSVAGILERKEYTGCAVNFKTYSKSHKLKSGCITPRRTSGFSPIPSLPLSTNKSLRGCRNCGRTSVAQLSKPNGKGCFLVCCTAPTV